MSFDAGPEAVVESNRLYRTDTIEVGVFQGTNYNYSGNDELTPKEGKNMDRG